MGMVELVRLKGFLGTEFLTWLWWQSEQAGQVEPAGGGKPVKLELTRQIMLEAQYGDTRKATLKGISPGTSAEAKRALVEGKKLASATLRMVREDVTWELTLGSELAVRGLKLMKVEGLEIDDTVIMRTEALMEFEGVLSALYKTFLAKRLDERAWRVELGWIRSWVGEE